MVEKILVAGGGAMGSGIAFVAARAGYAVDVIEPEAGARERARARWAKDAQRADDPSILDRLTFLDEAPAAADAVLAIEAVPERYEIKQDILRKLERALPASAVLATNTSSLSVAELADCVTHPERVVGLHFFNPPVAMKLVEIVATDRTSEPVLAAARAFVERIGKTGVDAADTPGFIVNRVARPFYLQSMRALDLGVASAPELDALARAAGFRMGPFELMDLIGIDVNYATSVSVYERLQAERLTPIEMQREMVAEGRLGRKTGAGFYDYAHGEPERIDAGVEPAADDETNVEELVCVIGYGPLTDHLTELLQARFANLVALPNDEMLDEIPVDATLVVDCGDGENDRGAILASLDSLLGPDTMIFADAYATDIGAAASRMRHPERLVGYGVLGALENQRAVEIVDSDIVSDDALALAAELFESIGKGVVLVEDVPGLYLGRVVGSIVNEAVIAVAQDVATADDIDVAMRLGVNYPQGPIAWGREIGGRRLSRILRRIAQSEGEAYGPHRALWVLDVHQEEGELADAGA
ncbi:MAG TPA: 3-hydroxyacyl-CoA dehydrogenase NAD-binding domain-containing protein [Candidatus Aquilonibacter sp.]|nr:3-hydroxyacyl-CoA dehydrogenase NAD-binding domain-containing protein [Candidatus Aquilonibacter sp.]